jgi:hypothetical protein
MHVLDAEVFGYLHQKPPRLHLAIACITINRLDHDAIVIVTAPEATQQCRQDLACTAVSTFLANWADAP